MSTSTTPQLLIVDVHADRREPADVEIVIPVYNEQAGLETSIRRLVTYLHDRFPLRWLVTIADNASVDRTWGIACRLAAELDGVRAVHLDQKGRGRALRAVWSASDAPVVAYMDVDLSTDLDALLPLVAPLLSGHSDVAIGTRLAAGARVVRGPKREAISRSYNLILKATLHSGFSDAQCGFKAVRGSVAQALLPMVEDDGWFFDTELLVLAEHNGLRIHEVPVDWVDDPDSRVHVVGTAKADLQGVWRMLGSTASGRASIAEGVLRRLRGDDRAPAPDLASQLVRFASIGLVSTIVFAALFLLLVEPLGALLANVVALGVCTVANAAANRRLTFSLRGRAGRTRHVVGSALLATLPFALTLGTLAGLAALDVTTVAVQLVALTAANAMASLVRFVAMRGWVFKPESRDLGSESDRHDDEDDEDQDREQATGATVDGRGHRSLVRRARQVVRYAAVSVIATSVSLTVLGVLVSTATVAAGWANVIATAVGTVPSFELNRRWVWGKTGERSLRAEVGPFVALSFAGLALSTLTVSLAARWAAGAGLDAMMTTVAVEAASIVAFGSLWIAQFVILDRVLFGRTSNRPRAAGGVPALAADATVATSSTALESVPAA